MYDKITMSSGHGKYIRGAADILDEVDEARKVVERVADELRERGVDVSTFHDDTSHDQNTNLHTIVNWHNSIPCELATSIHFNAYEHTTRPMGVECLYVTQEALSREISAAVASCGFIDRGPKKRTDLYFLNETEMPAVLLEICFVDSVADADLYSQKFTAVCTAIADVLGGPIAVEHPPEPPAGSRPPGGSPEALLHVTGTCSSFGGPEDEGVSPSEGLAFLYEIEDAPQLFLPFQPPGTTGLARRLNPYVHYVACRWDYDVTPKNMLRDGTLALVKNSRTGAQLLAFPADWGPNQNTGRVADLSPGLLDDLGLSTDDEVEVIFPAPDTEV